MAKKKRSRLPAGVKLLVDGRYQVRATYVDPVTRKRKDQVSTLPHQSTLVEAIAHLDAMRQDLLTSSKLASVPSLEGCAQTWLARKASRGAKATTIEAYSYSLGHCLARTRLDPTTLPIDAYTRDHLIALRGELEAVVGYSPESILDWWKVWVRMLRDICADRGLPDPTHRLESPAVSGPTKREKRTLSREQVKQFVEHVVSTSQGGDYDVFIALLAYTGMRYGEGLALQWDAVVLEHRIITIRRSVTHTKEAGWVVSLPKKDKVRKVAICAPLLEVLQKARKRRLPVGLVCCSRAGGYLMMRTVRRRLKAAVEALGLDVHVTPQVLRRTFNTLATEAVDGVLVRAMMGHASSDMTRHYLGVRDETLVGAVDRMWEFDVGVRSHTGAQSKN